MTAGDERTSIRGRRRRPATTCVVGRGLLARARRRARPDGREGAHRASRRRSAPGPRRCASSCRAGSRCSSPRSPTPRRPSASRSPRSAGRSSARPTSPAPMPSIGLRRRRDRPTSPASSPPPGCAACGSSRCRPPCSAWSTPPSAARPASTPHEGKNLVGAFHAPARGARATSTLLDTLPRNEILAGLRRDREGRLHRRARDPRHHRGRRRRRDRPDDAASSAASSSSRSRMKARGRRRGLHRAGPARDPQLRPHPRPRDRARRALPVAARRGRLGRHGVRRRARPAHRAALATTSSTGTAHPRPRSALPTSYPAGRWKTLLATMQRDKKARGGHAAVHRARRPRDARRCCTAPDESLLFAAYQEIGS